MITTTGFTLTGTDAGNYTLTQPTLSADINAKSLTITGLTGNNKVYDGTNNATASGTATLLGLVGAEVVTLSGTPVFSFVTPGVGMGIMITTTGYTLSGVQAGNYTLIQPTLSADITATPIPTLSQWGLFFMGLVFSIVGVISIKPSVASAT